MVLDEVLVTEVVVMVELEILVVMEPVLVEVLAEEVLDVPDVVAGPVPV